MRMQSNSPIYPLALLMLGAAVGPVLAADNGGTCSRGDKSYRFVDTVFYTEPNTFDETKTDRVLVFSSIPLDKVAVGRAKEKDAAIREQIWKATDASSIQLSIDDENSVWAMHFNAGGTSLSQSGTGVGELKIDSGDAARMTGSFHVAGDEEDLACDLSFDIAKDELDAAAAAAPPLPKGKPLPKGGGEAGAVFQRNLTAVREGDIEGMIATSAAVTREQMEEARKDPKFGEMIEMMQAFAPAALTVTGGEDFGDTAELTLEGAGEEDGKVTGTASMVKEDGKWKVVKTSLKHE